MRTARTGHASPSSTQHYTKISPTRLAKAYSDAGYFARNLRTIEVLLDRDAVTSGAAVDDGQAALDQLLARLANVPTPAGPTPRDLAAGTRALPIVAITNSNGGTT
jgi:hypothetical protein